GGAYVRLNLHLGWQAAESYVERSNAFALIPGHRLLLDCSAAEQPTSEGNSFARHASERGHGTLEGVPRQQVGCSAEGLRLGRSNSAILPRASRDKRGNGTLVRPSLGERDEGVAASQALASAHPVLLRRFGRSRDILYTPPKGAAMFPCEEA